MIAETQATAAGRSRPPLMLIIVLIGLISATSLTRATGEQTSATESGRSPIESHHNQNTHHHHQDQPPNQASSAHRTLSSAIETATKNETDWLARTTLATETVTKAATTTTTTSEIHEPQAGKQPLPASKSQSSQQSSSGKKCDYDRGQWQSCAPDGSQQKVMRLRAGDRSVCKPTRTIRRDCRLAGEIGCKYARGEWSATCQDGLRVRIDTLIGTVEPNADQPDPHQQDDSATTSGPLSHALPAGAKCKAHRRVTKDCGRTCHYVKSAWSECASDGFKTRVLTLEEHRPNHDERAQPTALVRRHLGAPAAADYNDTAAGQSENGRDERGQLETSTATTPATTAGCGGRARRPGDNQICARQKLVRRECRVGGAGPKLAPGQWATAASQPQQRQQIINAQQTGRGANSASAGSGGGGGTMKQMQRRRLKQIQLKQAAASTANSGAVELVETATTTLGSASAPQTTKHRAAGVALAEHRASGSGDKSRASPAG